jgi:hypothetical protein
MDNRLQNKPQHNTAFVLGNGKSRLRLKLDELKFHGSTYGCNALYREYIPDYLIAVDEKMVKEIEKSGYHLKNNVWTNPNKGVLKIPGLNYFKPHKGWSSGPTALWLAAKNNHTNIYIFGFDYEGIDRKVNNIYADTPNYKKSTDVATYYGNWLHQTEQVIRDNKHIKFTRVVDTLNFRPPTLNQITTNFEHISYEDFERRFSGTTIK